MAYNKLTQACWATPLPQLNTAKPSNISHVWKVVFELHTSVGDKTHICSLCLEDIATGSAKQKKWEPALFKFSNTSNVLKHLREVHPESSKEISKKRPREDNQTQLQFKVPTVGHRQFVWWVIATGQPFGVGDSPEFRNFCASLSPTFVPPARDTLRHIVDSIWVDFLAHLKSMIAGLATEFGGKRFLHMMHDTCTFVNKTTFVGFSASFITKNWKKHTVALGLVPLSQGHTAQDMAQSISDSIFANFGVPNSWVFSQMSDTASAALKVAEEFGVEGEMCSMHTADLILSHACGIKWKQGKEFAQGRELIEKHSALAAHFTRSTQNYNKLKLLAERNQLFFVSPACRQATRMASTHAMLKRNLLLQPVFTLYFAQAQEECSLNLTKPEWEATLGIEAVLAAVATVLKCSQVQSAVVASYNWVFALHMRAAVESKEIQVLDVEAATSLEHASRKAQSMSLLHSTAKQVVERVLDEIEFRFAEPTELEEMAMVLDPRTKSLRFLCDEWQKESFKHVEALIKELAQSSARARDSVDTMSTVDQLSVPCDPCGVSNVFSELSMWKEFSPDWNKWLGDRGLPTYDSAIPLMDLFSKVDVCEWWRAHEAKFPLVGLAARRILGANSSQGFQERVFSTAKFVLDPTRAKLSHAMFQEQTILRHNSAWLEENGLLSRSFGAK